jgi:quinol monooxygenase YgiN
MAGTEGATDTRPSSDETVAMIRIPTRRGQSKEVIAVLRSVVGPTLAQPSCRECDVVIDAIEDRYVLFHERWSSFQDFERHVRSDPYERVLSALEMASGVPEVRFECMGRTWGLDLVSDVRLARETAGD